MKRYLSVLWIIFPFLLFKLFNLSVRLSDSNIYFYTGYQLLHGKILYRDIFFTNFPMLPYVSALYFLLLFGNLKLFFLTPAIEASIVAFLIYLIVSKQTRNVLLSALSSLLYLCSFIVLSTSDHQSGVFLASLFAVLSYYFFQEKKYLLTGVFITLALLTKAYFIPILVAYLFTLFFEPFDSAQGKLDREHTLSQLPQLLRRISWFLAGFIFTCFIILLPTLLFAFPDFIKDVFVYSLTRTQGVQKGTLLWFFFTHDIVLSVIVLWNLTLLIKKQFFGFLSLFGILFFFFYQDIYYLYLNFLIPFLCLSFPFLYETLHKQLKLQKYIAPTLIAIALLINLSVYLTGYKNLQKVDIVTMTAAIKKVNPPVLYGINSLTPALSYTTGIPLLDTIIDTNPNIYHKGILSARTMSEDAVRQHALLVANGVDYPSYGVRQLVTDEIFDLKTLQKPCTLTNEFPVQNEGTENIISFVSCR